MNRACSQNGRSLNCLTGRHRRRWEENIRIDFKVTGFNARNWV